MRPTVPVLILLALPILEIAAFIYVGAVIGVFKTLILVVMAAIVGVMVLRYQGLAVLRKINRDVQTGHAPEAGIMHGFLIAIAGILLIIPGFITDIIGLLLLVPPIRNLIWRFVSRNMVVSYSFRGQGFRRGRRRDDFVDLSPEDYRRDDKDKSDPRENDPRLNPPE